MQQFSPVIGPHAYFRGMWRAGVSSAAQSLDSPAVPDFTRNQASDYASPKTKTWDPEIKFIIHNKLINNPESQMKERWAV